PGCRGLSRKLARRTGDPRHPGYDRGRGRQEPDRAHGAHSRRHGPERPRFQYHSALRPRLSPTLPAQPLGMLDSVPDLPDFPSCEVWLAGAGPGDPRWRTVLALHALSLADEVVHDARVDRRLLARARKDAELIPAGKRGGRPSPHQRDIN